jgi:TrmH family RNA methyltransferase
MITSRQNAKVKQVIQLSSRSKYRREDSAYVVEGVRILEESLRSGKLPIFALYTASLDQRGQVLLEAFQKKGIPCEEVDPALFQEASSTETSQGILGVIPIQKTEIPGTLDLILILDEIRDPGNLGTLLRTALAAGVDLVILAKGCADPYSPKVVRSGMGAHFQLPLLQAEWDQIPGLIPGLKLVLADMKAEQSLWEADLRGPVGLIIGSEAHGAGEAARQAADLQIRIPMDTRAESLNAAAAGAVLLFEIRRQHNQLDQ